jgi:hypothetical protein
MWVISRPQSFSLNMKPLVSVPLGSNFMIWGMEGG